MGNIIATVGNLRTSLKVSGNITLSNVNQEEKSKKSIMLAKEERYTIKNDNTYYSCNTSNKNITTPLIENNCVNPDNDDEYYYDKDPNISNDKMGYTIDKNLWNILEKISSIDNNKDSKNCLSVSDFNKLDPSKLKSSGLLDLQKDGTKGIYHLTYKDENGIKKEFYCDFEVKGENYKVQDFENLGIARHEKDVQKREELANAKAKKDNELSTQELVQKTVINGIKYVWNGIKNLWNSCFK